LLCFCFLLCPAFLLSAHKVTYSYIYKKSKNSLSCIVHLYCHCNVCFFVLRSHTCSSKKKYADFAGWGCVTLRLLAESSPQIATGKTHRDQDAAKLIGVGLLLLT
jgi:hypothetical protein